VISNSGNRLFLFAALRLAESGFAGCQGLFPPAVPIASFAAALSSFYHPVKVVAASTLRVSPVRRSTAPVTP
jgi:hypothetical protein